MYSHPLHLSRLTHCLNRLYAALCRSLTLIRMYRALLWLQSAQSIGVGIYLLIWLYRETRLQWDALCDLVSGADRVKCEAWMGIFVASYTGAIGILWLCQICASRDLRPVVPKTDLNLPLRYPQAYS